MDSDMLNSLTTEQICTCLSVEPDFYLELDIDVINETICEAAVKYDGYLLYNIPKQYMSEKLCEIAVINNGCSILHVPDEYKCKELYMLAFQSDPCSIQYIPQEFHVHDMIDPIIETNYFYYEFLRADLKTKEVELYVLKKLKELEYTIKNKLKM